MNRKDSNTPGRDEMDSSSIGGRDRDLDELGRRSHGGTQNGSTESARERWLSDVRDGGKHKHQVTGPTDE